MPTVDFLPFANDSAAVVRTQSEWTGYASGSGRVALGFPSGLLPAKDLNKALRQSSVMAAALARAIAQILGQNVLDAGGDGAVSTLRDQILSMLQQGSLPPGITLPFGGDAAPTGYLLCRGQAVSRTTYAPLFAAIGTKFGAGNGSTTFNIPKSNGRSLIGIDPDAEILSGATSVGATGGEASHVLTVAEMPEHGHGVNDPGHVHPYDRPTINTYDDAEAGPGGQVVISNVSTGTAMTGISIQPTGGGQAHNNMSPFLAMNYIIKT